MSIQVKEIAFVYNQVTDIVRARRFYEEFLGLIVGVEYEGAPGKWWIEYDVGGVTFGITNFEPFVGRGVGVREGDAQRSVVDVPVVEMGDEGVLVRRAELG